jgi:hypothetical protein
MADGCCDAVSKSLWSAFKHPSSARGRDRVCPLNLGRPQWRGKMNSNTNGEVYGSKVLNLAIIGTTVLILLGILWQPAPSHAVANKPAAQVEQVVVTAPAANAKAG